MFKPNMRPCDAIEDFGAGGGAGTARERIGDISRRLESRASSHPRPAAEAAFPHAHIAGVPDVAMAPETGIYRDRRLVRAARAAGMGIGTAVRYIDRARHAGSNAADTASYYAHRARAIALRGTERVREIRSMRREDARQTVEDFVVAHPSALLGAAAAGFIAARLLRR